MTATNEEHRPLVSGILVTTARRVRNNLQPINGGTLTGLARKPDGTKVLVTSTHVARISTPCTHHLSAPNRLPQPSAAYPNNDDPTPPTPK